MKNILVPTDFSDNAKNALKYAARLAPYLETELTILHAYKLLQRAGSFIALEQKMSKQAKKDIKKMIEELNKREKADTVIKTKVIKGKTIPVIAETAKKKKADLIIMGTQGASGLREIFIGSTTSGVIKNTDLPVLAIPSGFVYKKPRKIVFAIDDDFRAAKDNVKTLIDLTKALKAKVLFFNVQVKDTDNNVDAKITEEFKEIKSSFHQVASENINEAIHQFVKEEEADILCMIKRNRGFVGNALHKSVTQREVYHSDVPLLILHGT